MGLRKIASLFAGLVLVAGLLGSGVGAAFVDQVTAQMNVQVGTFGCTIDSTTPGAVVSADLHSVTYDAPEILASAPGNLPFDSTVTSTGDVPVLVHLTQTTPAAPFTSMLAAPADVTLAAFASITYAGGLQWPELGTSDLGVVASITYTADCGEVPAGPTPIDPSRTAQRPGNHSVFVCQYVAPLTLTGIVIIANTNIWPNPGFLIQYPAGNQIGSRAYVLAYNDNDGWTPPLSACPLDPYGL